MRPSWRSHSLLQIYVNTVVEMQINDSGTAIGNTLDACGLKVITYAYAFSLQFVTCNVNYIPNFASCEEGIQDCNTKICSAGSHRTSSVMTT